MTKNVETTIEESDLQLIYLHQMLTQDQKLHDYIKAGPSCTQIIDVIMSRMINKKHEYIVSLDQKWMNLQFMGHVYSNLERITHEVVEEVKGNTIQTKNLPKKWGLGYFA